MVPTFHRPYVAMSPPDPTPPTMAQCHAARATLKAIVTALPDGHQRSLAPHTACLLDFIRACENYAHHIYEKGTAHVS